MRMQLNEMMITRNTLPTVLLAKVHHETCKDLIANGVRRSMSSMLTSIGSTPVQRRDPPESVQDHMCRYLRLMEDIERPRGPQPSVK